MVISGVGSVKPSGRGTAWAVTGSDKIGKPILKNEFCIIINHEMKVHRLNFVSIYISLV